MQFLDCSNLNSTGVLPNNEFASALNQNNTYALLNESTNKLIKCDLLNKNNLSFFANNAVNNTDYSSIYAPFFAAAINPTNAAVAAAATLFDLNSSTNNLAFNYDPNVTSSINSLNSSALTSSLEQNSNFRNLKTQLLAITALKQHLATINTAQIAPTALSTPNVIQNLKN